MKPPPPDFRSPDFLRAQVLRTMAFLDGRCVDASGGFFHAWHHDGSISDRRTRYLASSARMVATHARAARHFPDHERAPAWREAVRHGLAFLEQAHRDPSTGGYAWILQWDEGRRTVIDASQHACGAAFVLLAHAEALRAGIDEARAGMDTSFQLLETRFWEPEHGLYADEASAAWQLEPHRAQSANMHACEAMLACHEATGDMRYLERAATLAYTVTEVLARHDEDGLVWERYHADWSPDRSSIASPHEDAPRPRGFRTAHQAEWARLLLTLERLRPNHPSNQQLVHRARALFAAAVQHAWDRSHEGLVVEFGRDDTPGHDKRFVTLDARKAGHVHAEAIAACALLAERTLEGGYWDWYDRLWDFAWRHLFDREHGAWFELLSADNQQVDDRENANASAPGKTAYHAMGACYEVLASLNRTPT